MLNDDIRALLEKAGLPQGGCDPTVLSCGHCGNRDDQLDLHAVRTIRVKIPRNAWGGGGGWASTTQDGATADEIKTWLERHDGCAARAEADSKPGWRDA